MKAFKDFKKGGLLIVGLFFLCLSSSVALAQERQDIGMAVEFMDHAACAYVAKDKGWFKKEGLRLSACESYVTGMALAAALARGDIQAAYICLVPAINACANAGVSIKIVAGTHRYGYGLVVNPNKVKTALVQFDRCYFPLQIRLLRHLNLKKLLPGDPLVNHS